jgi:hypothetical protein
VNKPKSEVLAPGVDQIPFEAMERLGAIFAEGEIKYGRDNWKTAPHDKEFNAERTRHAIRHLMLYANGDRQEDHLAKVLWFAAIMIWRTTHQENPNLVIGLAPNGTPVIQLRDGTYSTIKPTIYTPEEYAAKQAFAEKLDPHTGSLRPVES